MKLWHKVFLGLVLGMFFGIYLPQHVETVKPIGTVFLCFIKMVLKGTINFLVLNF